MEYLYGSREEPMMDKMKIEFFKTKDCDLCESAESLLKLILAEKGLEYNRVVREKFTNASPEESRLGNLYVSKIPVIRIGERTLRGESVCNEDDLRKFLSDNGY